MKKQGLSSQRSGVVRCQRCLKYGHYTYECENEVAYRYRPSRTVMFKQKIKLQLNKDKGPKTIIKDQDYKRIYVQDRPSSDDQNVPQDENTKKGEIKKEQKQIQKNQKEVVQHHKDDEEQQQESQSSQSSSSSESSSQSSQQEPRKKRKI